VWSPVKKNKVFGLAGSASAALEIMLELFQKAEAGLSALEATSPPTVKLKAVPAAGAVLNEDPALFVPLPSVT
jgi:hypothetical protein